VGDDEAPKNEVGCLYSLWSWLEAHQPPDQRKEITDLPPSSFQDCHSRSLRPHCLRNKGFEACGTSDLVLVLPGFQAGHVASEILSFSETMKIDGPHRECETPSSTCGRASSNLVTPCGRA
jgi:hypothetical protein